MPPAPPETVFRITRADYATSAEVALSGKGGLRDDGRWHTRGRAIVYASQSSTLCLLERLVHADEWIAERRADRVLLALRVPRVGWTGFDAAELASRDPNWQAEGNLLCRRLGGAWLASAATCVLMVPSAANPTDFNVRFNPSHTAFALVLAANATLDVRPVALDERVVSLARARRAAP